MKHEIIGMNLLLFVVLTWVVIVAVLWLMDNIPEVWEQYRMIVEAAEKNRKKYDSELTAEMPVGSFDPDETMKLAVFRSDPENVIVGLPTVFVINKRHAPPGRRRHAKVT